MDHLSKLPPEILFMLVPHLDFPSLLCLIRCCRHNQSLLAALYQKDIRSAREFRPPSCGSWSCPTESTKQYAIHWISWRGFAAPLRVALGAAVIDRGYLDIKDGYHRTPLLIAAQCGHIELVKLLLDAGADSNSGDFQMYTPLSAAAKEGHEGIVRLLLDSWRRSDRARAAVDRRDHFGLTALSHAARNGYDSIVRLLLSAGADRYGCTISNGRWVDKDSRGCSPLFFAVQGGHESAALALLDSGLDDVNLRDCDSRTPLHWAVLGRNEVIIRALLDTGIVYVNCGDWGWTRILLTGQLSREDISRLLKEQKQGTGHSEDTRQGKQSRGRNPDNENARFTLSASA